MTTTEGKLYFILVSTLERREIQFVPPELGISRNANIQNVTIVGRNNPFYQYTSGETLLTLQLDFHAKQDDRKDVIESCRWFESILYNDNFDVPPEKVKLVFGDLFRDEVWTVKSCSYKLKNFDKVYGYLPTQAYVDLTLALDPSSNLTKEDVR